MVRHKLHWLHLITVTHLSIRAPLHLLKEAEGLGWSVQQCLEVLVLSGETSDSTNKIDLLITFRTNQSSFTMLWLKEECKCRTSR